MKRKLVVFLCALSLIGLTNAQEASETSYVASITIGTNTTKYATLAAAIAAAQSGDTITLLWDVNETGLALADKQITLALDGHTIPAGAIVISGSGEVTVIGESKTIPVSVNTSKGALLTLSKADDGNQTYCTGKLYYNNGELFAQGHALTIEGQDGTDSDTNLRLTYTEGDKSYTTLYTSTTAVRLFAGWKYPKIDTTEHAYTLTMKSGKVQSLRGSNKDQDGGSITSSTIVMEGGTADIIASAWYYCPSVRSFTVKISGGKVGTIYGNGETAYIASLKITTYKEPTVTEAKIEISGGTVGFVYGGGRALTEADTSANYAMRTVKATIDISGGTVTCVNGGGFNGPEADEGEDLGQDQVIVEEAEITVRGGTVANVFGGGYNGQWKWTYKYHETNGLVFSNYDGKKITTVRNTVTKSTVNVQEGAAITNLYLGGRSYAYVAETVANITGGTVGTLSMSGNYGYIAKSTATVSGGTIQKAELLTRNYAGNVSLAITGGTVGELYAGVGGAYKNSNSTEKETFNVCTLAVLGSATISAAEGTVSAAYLTTGLEKATAVTCNLPLTVKKMNLVEDSAYAGTLSYSGRFAIEASTANWLAEIAFASAGESFKPLADTTGSLTYTSLVEGMVVGIGEDGLTRSLIAPPPVAQIGETTYASLAAAVAAVPTDGTQTTIVLLQDCTGSGVVVDANKNIVFDLNGKTYTVTNPTVGSSGTETNGFQLLKDATVTFQNGTIESASAKILIQNYCKLTLKDVTLNAKKNAQIQYTLSNNFGQVTVTGKTKIYASAGQVAFDLYYWPKGGYGEGVSVTFDADFTGQVEGTIKYARDNTTTDEICAEKAILTVAEGAQGLFDVTFSTSVQEPNIQLKGGRYTKAPTTYCAKGYCCATNKLKIEQTVFYAVRKQSAVFEVCSTFSNGYQAAYENLTEALTAAQAFSTKLVNVVGAGTLSEDVTIPENTYLDIYASGASLTVPADKTLTVSANCKRLGVRTGTLTIEAGGKVLIAGGSSNAGFVAVWTSNSNASVTGEFSLPEGNVLCYTENTSMASYWSAPEADKVAEAKLADGRVANLTASAMSSLPTGWTQLKLFQDVSCNTIISTDNAVIDLNKKTWTGTSTSVGVFTITATGVTVKNGTVKAGASQPYAINLQSGSLKLESDAKITGGSRCALYCQGDTSLTTAGKITNTDAPAIAGNGNQSGTMITVTGGTITSTNSTAIYHPQRGTLEIQKGTIKGYNGIQMCAGELKVTGESTITATGTDIATSKTGTDGPINDGAAISVVNRSYPGGTPKVSVTASSATIMSNQAKAVNAYTWQDSASTKVCEPWPEAAQYIALFDGYYSEDVSVYCAKGYHAYYVATKDTPKWKVLVADTFEASVTHEEVVTQYATLSAANYALQAGDTLTLNSALESVGAFSIKVTKENLTWDLNGSTLKSPLNVQASGLKIKNGTMAPRNTFNPPATLKTTTGTQVNVTLEDVKVCQNDTASSTISLEVPGTLTLSGNTQVQAGSGTGIGCSATGVGVTVASSASITGALGVSIWGTKQNADSYNAQGVKVQVDGTITATEIGLNLYGNIKATEGAVPEIALGSTAQVSSSGVGIYAAGYGKWSVDKGAQISGALSGIEIRAGELTVNGGTIKSLAGSYSVEANGSGTTTVGAGIAVAQHTTELPLKVTITGGTISGYVALSEANPQGNDAEAIGQVSLDIRGGTFVAQSAAVVSADCTGFVSGGYFSNAVPLAYCAEGYSAYGVGTMWEVREGSSLFVVVDEQGQTTVETLEALLTEANLGKVVHVSASLTETQLTELAEKSLATTGPADDLKDATKVTGLTVKEVAEVLGGAFTVKQVKDAQGQTTETKLVYHYNFGVAGLEVRKQAETDALALTVVAKLTEGELPANRTLVGRTLQVVLTKGNGSEPETYSVANPVFNKEGECRVPVPWSAMTTGTNSIEVKVVK